MSTYGESDMMNGARTADDATGYAMSLMTATVSADTYMKAWASKSWISNLKDMPPAPYSMMDMYLVHQAMQDHALAVEAFGGIAGYKLGAVGVIPGETAVSAPLFKRFIVNAPEGVVSAEEINMHTLEAEVGVTMAQDLRPKPDGSLYTVQEVWQAVESVMPVIEMCGRRSTAECIAAQPPLGKLADALMSGGVVVGKRHPRESVDLPALSTYSTSLHINGVAAASGSSADVPDGCPIKSLTWCANHLISRGLFLQKGHLVITGATCKCSAFKVGDTVAAHLGALGIVETTIAT